MEAAKMAFKQKNRKGRKKKMKTSKVISDWELSKKRNNRQYRFKTKLGSGVLWYSKIPTFNKFKFGMTDWDQDLDGLDGYERYCLDQEVISLRIRISEKAENRAKRKFLKNSF